MLGSLGGGPSLPGDDTDLGPLDFLPSKHIPRQVLAQLKFTHGTQNAVVQEFWYDDEKMYNEMPEGNNTETPFSYARVFTQNSVDNQLLECLVGTSLQIAGLISSTSLASALFVESRFANLSAIVSWAFVGLLSLSTLIWVGAAAWFTRYKLKADEENAHDLVWRVSQFDKARIYVNHLFFYMFNVPVVLQKAPVFFHPAKAVQPYAIVQKGGSRAWILGWPGDFVFKYLEAEGLISQIPKLLVAGIPLLFLQVYIAVATEGVGFMQILTFTSTFLSVGKQVRDTLRVVHNRSKLYPFLKKMSHRQPQSVHERHQRNSAQRMLLQHFGENIENNRDPLLGEAGEVSGRDMKRTIPKEDMLTPCIEGSEGDPRSEGDPLLRTLKPQGPSLSELPPEQQTLIRLAWKRGVQQAGLHGSRQAGQVGQANHGQAHFGQVMYSANVANAADCYYLDKEGLVAAFKFLGIPRDLLQDLSSQDRFYDSSMPGFWCCTERNFYSQMVELMLSNSATSLSQARGLESALADIEKITAERDALLNQVAGSKTDNFTRKACCIVQ